MKLKRVWSGRYNVYSERLSVSDCPVRLGQIVRLRGVWAFFDTDLKGNLLGDNPRFTSRTLSSTRRDLEDSLG